MSWFMNKSRPKISKNRIILFFLSLSLFYVLTLNFLYYYYTGGFFEFGARDALYYNDIALKLIKEPIWNWIDSFIRTTLIEDAPLEDFGATFFVALAYLFYPSTFTYNILNILLGLITLLSLLRIAKKMMPGRYAMLTVVAYSFASFNLYFFSTGMKETAFVMFTVLTIERFYCFWSKKNIYNLILFVLVLLSLLFFRPAVMYLIILSIIAGISIPSIKSKYGFIILIISSLLFISLFSYYGEIIERYYGSSEKIEIGRESLGLTVNKFTYFVAFISSFIGPFPTILPFDGKEQQSLYSIGLILKVMLSGFFFVGIINIFKKKIIIAYPLVLFVLLEATSLFLILNSFELRFHLPHFPFIYLISFYCIYLFYSKEQMFGRRFLVRYLKYYIYIPMLLIVYWNLRF